MKNTIISALSHLTDSTKRRALMKGVIRAIVDFPRGVVGFISFMVLLQIFIFRLIARGMGRLPFLGKLLHRLVPSGLTGRTNSLFDKLINKIESVRSFKVKRYYLINLAFNNLKIKKSRSLITIFGMSVGVGIIVYLLSLGYGIEKMVISKVARLEELKMTDVVPGETGDVKINKKLMEKISKIKNVETVLPLVSVVGKVNYKNAKTDILGYAVTDQYLEALGNQILEGEYFVDKGNYLGYKELQVRGASTSLISARLGQRVSPDNVLFNFEPGVLATVWDQCSLEGKVLGYTQRVEGGYFGEEYWGSEYAPFYPSGRIAQDRRLGQSLGKWLKAKFALYDKLPEDKVQPKTDENGRPLWEEGCITEKGIVIDTKLHFAEVLGEATESAVTDTEAVGEATPSALPEMDMVVLSSSSGGLELVTLESSSSAAVAIKEATDVIKFQSRPMAKTVISSGMASFLDIPLKEAVGQRFKVSYILVKNLVSNESGKLTTEELEMEIIGVISDDTAEYFYLPLSDMQKLGLRNFSQLKVVVQDKEKLTETRKNIEVLGVTTSSTADTVAQIESLFLNIRLLLGLLGTIALGVAALGMFNTLTVSLLERTREIGGMKTMGMVSGEIQELFLSEALIMGFAGGVGGLFLGFFVGELTSFMVSLVAVARGVGYLKLSYIPPFLVLFILSSSFFVGIVTGLYPARRARKTSALNALRYE